MKTYIPQKYKWWELWFGEYQFIRRLSCAYWVKLEEPGYRWVKFDKADFQSRKFPISTKFTIEDYTN